MIHWLALEKRQIPHPQTAIQKFSHASNHLFKCEYPISHTQNILIKSPKAILRRFVHFKKLFIPESPHLTGFFKSSQILQQNSEYMNNDP